MSGSAECNTYFNEKEVDELLLLDSTASREKREPDYSTIEEFATECFMPFCYGGGIATLAQADRKFSLGVQKWVCSQRPATNLIYRR